MSRDPDEDDGVVWADAREYVTAQEAADFLSVHVRTIYNYAGRGILTRYFIVGSRSLRFKRIDVESMLRDEHNQERRTE
jgi:excisionase family DNA binding protein